MQLLSLKLKKTNGERPELEVAWHGQNVLSVRDCAEIDYFVRVTDAFYDAQSS